MQFPLHVILTDDRQIIINEEQVCSIEPVGHVAKIRMSNGDEWMVRSPTFAEWENDVIKRDY